MKNYVATARVFAEKTGFYFYLEMKTMVMLSVYVCLFVHVYKIFMNH